MRISEEMNISRPNISRMLEQALSAGVVTIQINDPFSSEEKLSNWFRTTFDLMGMYIIDSQENSDEHYKKICDALEKDIDFSVKD